MSNINEKQTVLVVDDVQDSIEILNRILQDDYRVLFSTDGVTAIELAQQHKPDIVLLDVAMPGMDGYQVCRELKSNAETREIPVIFVTAKEGDEDQEKGFRIGGADYLTKPVRPALVRVRVANQLKLRRNEEGLRRMQKMEAVGRLTGGIAHDFNNILGVILGNLEFLRPMVAHDETAATRVKAADEAAMRAADLVAQLLDFSRVESKDISATDLNQVIHDNKEKMTGLLRPEIEIETCLADGLWPADIDRSDFEDALTNLVVNAGDAIPEAGKITIETSNRVFDSLYEAHDPTVKPGDYLQLMVTDNGIGMSPEVLAHIFEPFFTTKSQSDGAGLGLSTVYSFVQRSGGFIKAASEPGDGTTVRLFLPRSMNDAQGQTNASIDEVGILPGQGETVLIVDDETDLLDMTKMRLDALNYNTLIASSGEVALDILAKHEGVDLLFSDVVMPGGIDGYELAKQAVTVRPGLKVLLTSGYLDADLLTKPYTQAELAQRLRAELE